MRQCWRYLNNRLDQLDYPGAWWSATHASSMLALRLNRANAEWESYWAYGQRFAA